MFFDENRINVMRQMILAEDSNERKNALDKLLPMQRKDFEDLFLIMKGLPVTIRLLDPLYMNFCLIMKSGFAFYNSRNV